MILQIIDLGRLHPLLVHMPIGILILVFLMELYFRKKPNVLNQDILKFALGLAAITTVLSVISGWLLGEGGGYDETLLFRHRWMAVGLAVGATILFLLKKYPKKWSTTIYLPLFILIMGLLGLTGHVGGSMTHGEGYLFTTNETKKTVITNVEQAMVYQDIVQPIFDAKCTSCHNPNKVKGGLIMTTKEQLLKGGDSGNLLMAVQGEPTRLMHHIKLPMEDEDHMPPKGKVQLSNNEIALLEWWIANENCFDCFAGTLEKNEKINEILVSLEEDTSPRAQIAKKLELVPDNWLTKINQNGTTVTPLATNNPLLIVNLSGEKQLTKENFKELKKYAEHIVELNLANSNLNDDLSSQLTPFKNLTKLQLQNTAITDKSLERLRHMQFLESLNLYGTAITDIGLEKLTSLTGLKTVYTWQSMISQKALDSFDSQHPNVSVVRVDKDLFLPTHLDPPVIVSERDFFKDSLTISLESFHEGTSIYYTLDGSPPDSTSLKYQKPILLTQSAHIKAVTHKTGWDLSTIKSASFKKSAFTYNSVTLEVQPHEKYKGHGNQTLIDQKRGSDNFLDGNWLGYEGSSFKATIELEKEELISTVSIGSLSAPQQWIFFPRGFKVWVSNDGNHYKLIHSEQLEAEKPNTDTKFNFFDLAIPPTKSNYVRVEVISQRQNPSWHPNPGEKSWLFIDEVVLN